MNYNPLARKHVHRCRALLVGADDEAHCQPEAPQRGEHRPDLASSDLSRRVRVAAAPPSNVSSCDGGGDGCGDGGGDAMSSARRLAE